MRMGEKVEGGRRGTGGKMQGVGSGRPVWPLERLKEGPALIVWTVLQVWGERQTSGRAGDCTLLPIPAQQGRSITKGSEGRAADSALLHPPAVTPLQLQSLHPHPCAGQKHHRRQRAGGS